MPSNSYIVLAYFDQMDYCGSPTKDYFLKREEQFQYTTIFQLYHGGQETGVPGKKNK